MHEVGCHTVNPRQSTNVPDNSVVGDSEDDKSALLLPQTTVRGTETAGYVIEMIALG